MLHRKNPEYEGFELYKQIVSNMPMIFYVIDSDWVFKVSYGQALQKLGLEPNQAVGLSAKEMYRDHPGIIQAIEKAFNGQKTHDEFRIGEIYVENFIVPDYDQNGKIVGVIGVATDITERKAAEATLDRTSRFSNAVMSSVPGMLYMYNSEGQLVFWNNSHKTMTGYTDEELRNMRLFDWYPDDPESQKAITDGLAKMEETGFGEAEANLRTKSGAKLPMYFTASPLIRDDEQYFVGIGVDISSRKKAEEQLIELNRTLEEKVEERTQDLLLTNQSLVAANTKLLEMQAYLVESEKMAALGALVAGVAHEVNTPIGVSITAASHLSDVAQELLERYNRKEMDGEFVESLITDLGKASGIIVRNLNQAGYLIKNFKQLSVDQSLEPQREFDLGDYLDEILVSISPTYKKTHIAIKTHYSGELIINGWPGAFAQIVNNLVMNSMQHAFLPGEQGQIDIEISQIEEGVSIIFRDNGHGMQKEVLDRIFEPFFTTKRSSGGTGLGLSIVYTIVTQRYRGSIRCESEPEKGTSFFIVLIGGKTNE